MSNSAAVYQLDPHGNMSPTECLEYCARQAAEYQDVIVAGYDERGELVVRSSGMSRKDALWLLMAAADYARNKD